MPGRVCAVASCKNNQLAIKKKGSYLRFHCFPKSNDIVSSTRQKEWVHRCKRTDKFNADNAVICSDHFTDGDYERDLQHELLNLPSRKVLKKTAVPTRKLGGDEKLPETTTPREKRAQKKNNKEIVDSLLASSSICDSPLKHQPLSSTSEGGASVDNLTPEVLTATEESVLPPPSPPLQLTKPQTTVQPDLELTKLKVKHEELLQKYTLLRTSSNKKIRGLNQMVKYYKNRYNCAASTEKKAQVAEKLLNMVLTKNQIDLLSCRKKLIHWTQEETAIALTIRYYSKKCYLYLKNYLNYPLPSLSSLNNFKNNFNNPLSSLSEKKNN